MSIQESSRVPQYSCSTQFKNRFKKGILSYSETLQVEYKPENGEWNFLGWLYASLMIFLTVVVAYIAYDNDSFYEMHVGQGTVSTRVNGAVDTSRVTDAELNMKDSEYYKRVWTPQDIAYPHTERHLNDLTVMTNVFIIPNQTMGYCPGVESKYLYCRNDSNCDLMNPQQRNDAGVITGRCISVDGSPYKRCEMHGYCPPYFPAFHPFPFNRTRALLEDVGNFTFIVVKSSIKFLKGRTFWNVPQSSNSTYLNDCFYDFKSDLVCPKFKIKDIVKGAGDEYEFSEIAIKGGMFKIKVRFDCEFPLELFSLKLGGPPFCVTKYFFKRMDEDLSIAPRWSYDCSIQLDDRRRIFRQCFGIKIFLEVEGIAKQLTLKRIVIDTLLSSSSYVFLPGLILKLVLRFLTNKDSYKGNTIVRKHPSLGKNFCCCHLICHDAKEDVKLKDESTPLQCEVRFVRSAKYGYSQ